MHHGHSSPCHEPLASPKQGASSPAASDTGAAEVAALPNSPPPETFVARDDDGRRGVRDRERSTTPDPGLVGGGWINAVLAGWDDRKHRVRCRGRSRSGRPKTIGGGMPNLDGFRSRVDLPEHPPSTTARGTCRGQKPERERHRRHVGERSLMIVGENVALIGREMRTQVEAQAVHYMGGRWPATLDHSVVPGAPRYAVLVWILQKTEWNGT